jgi:hypothetical protein
MLGDNVNGKHLVHSSFCIDKIAWQVTIADEI